MKLRLNNFPFFYGYLILFAGAVGAIMSAPGQTISVSVFTNHLLKAFEITRVELSWTYLTGTLISAFLLTWGGRMYDKYGAKLIAFGAAILLGAFLLLLTQVDIFSEYINNIFPSLSYKTLIFSLLTIGFLGIRFMGQGVIAMVSRNMVMKWFEKKRGMASAIFGVALIICFSVSPKIFSDLIQSYGWKQTWIIIAIVSMFGFGLFVLLFYRDNPQKYGLLPDGKFKSGKKSIAIQNNNTKAPQKQYTLLESIRTYTFWAFTLALFMFGLFYTAITFHIEDIFQLAGLAKEKAISIFIPTAVIAIFIQLIAGYIADYIELKYLLILFLAGLIISSCSVIYLNNDMVIWFLIIGNSLTLGVFGIISSMTWPQLYGTKHLGAISGFAISWVVIGSAIGPLLFSYSNDLSGNYIFALLICLLFSIILLIMGFWATQK